jgi:chromosome segregation ATPase
MRTGSIALLASLVLLAGAPDAAAPPAAAGAGAAEESPAHADWLAVLDEKAARLEALRVEVSEREVELADAQRRRYPRGEAKAQLERELARAQAALARAEQELPQLVEQARREGVPGELLRRYEALGADS